MNDSSRRVFLLHVAAGGPALWAASALAQPAMVSATEPTAIALGYTPDTQKVDARKFPNHRPTQSCRNCQLYAGKPADSIGNCTIFTGKMVVANGWCSAHILKS
ncbi:high-potential iron-sulfur protein [Hydrogenophaga laconesensis]|uniref:High-potential iron-sulfur protein n=1 Tax=Hydrogenophaga laconesensis TaxID=1805971 RepID=A0ABU1V5D4_9BURK|nr:high-potential iron-sulfur protein [Hydrogenophaga laconesensis]MDR7092669.1 hypothetical protein [Hydrogenophaga laconesensis]